MAEGCYYSDRDHVDAKEEEQGLDSQYGVEDGIELVDNRPLSVELANEATTTFYTTLVVTDYAVVQVLSCIHRVCRETTIFVKKSFSVVPSDW